MCEAGAGSLVILSFFGTMQVQNENHLRQLATIFCIESMTEIIIISIRVIKYEIGFGVRSQNLKAYVYM